MSIILHHLCSGQIVLGGIGYKCLKCNELFRLPLTDVGTQFGDLVRVMRPWKSWDEKLIKGTF